MKGKTEFTFNVPSGIGDLSWLYSKLCNLDKPFNLKICGDNPRRTLPFVELLPMVHEAEYGSFSYMPTFIMEERGLPADTDLKTLPPGEYYLSVNAHLESGARIETFLPSLPINYHYPIYLRGHKSALFQKSREIITDEILIGVYPSKYANYRHNNDWVFWDVDGWTEFLRQVQIELGGACRFVFIGAEFDNDLGNDIAAEVEQFAKVTNLIARTHIGEVISLMHCLDYLFAYASGIGILGDVVNIPTMHFLPTPRHDTLIDTYADPENIKSGKHLNIKFCPVGHALDIFNEKGKAFIQ